MIYETDLDKEISSYMSMRRMTLNDLPLNKVGNWWKQWSQNYPKLSAIATAIHGQTYGGMCRIRTLVLTT